MNPSASPETTTPSSRSDTGMLLAIGVSVYLLANLVHEAVGHGGACLLLGGHPLALSSTYFAFDDPLGQLSWWESRWIAAAGTLANLLFGLLCLVLLRARATRARLHPAGRYFLWLSMSVNLFQAGGYLMVSPFAGFGDWQGFLGGLEPRLTWQIALTVLGIVISFGALFLSLWHLDPFLGRTGRERVRRACRLTVIPYLAGGMVMCVAGLFNPAGAHLVVLSAAASSFAGTSFLPWVTAWVRREAPWAVEALIIERRGSWLAAGLILTALCIGLLGPSISLSH